MPARCAGKENMMNVTLKSRLGPVIAISSAILFAAAFAWATPQPCVSNIPKCPANFPTDNGAGPECPGGYTALEGPEEIDVYMCNGKDADCDNTAGDCNVMIEYICTGYLIQCTAGGPTQFCVTSGGSYGVTNVQCGTTDTCCPATSDTCTPLPSGYPTAGWGGRYGYISYTPYSYGG